MQLGYPKSIKIVASPFRVAGRGEGSEKIRYLDN